MRMNHLSTLLAMATLSLSALGFTACVSSDDEPSQKTPAADITLRTSQSQLTTCTPGYKSCDFSCYYSGGPSSDDCIVQCNPAGNGYLPVQSCGWAQNSVYSSSCLDLPPSNAICKWN